jgi:hypothetical protein
MCSRTEPPPDFEGAGTRSWAAVGHFLLVEADRDQVLVHPVGDAADDGTPQLIERAGPSGAPVAGPIQLT